MVRKKLSGAIVGTLVLASFVVSSCTSAEVQQVEITQLAPETVEITVVVPQTVIVTQVVQVVVTATPEPSTPTLESTATLEPSTPTPEATSTPQPPTPTPEATSTPEPSTSIPEATSTPKLKQWASSQVIEAFKAAGLEAESPRVMTRDDYGMAPMLAIEGTRFFIPSLCPDCGGRVLSFSSQKNLETTKAYYIELGKSSAAFFSWVFAKDNILVQINGSLSEETARQYEAALATLE